jgi:hypothetical protein
MTEDKADVSARVAWSGVGIDLQTHQPTAAALWTAVRLFSGKHSATVPFGCGKRTVLAAIYPFQRIF